jgi:3-phosphoshikimate 1-carboxyvinyltransferase
VTKPLLEALTGLGVPYHLDDTHLRVEGVGLRGFRSPKGALNCGNSATTMRLLAGAVATSGVFAVLDGSSGLRSRPMERITTPLRLLGVKVAAATDERAPLTLAARPARKQLYAINYSLPVASA